MSNYRVAVRYARSLFELSVEQKKLEEVKIDMEMLNTLCIQNKAFRNFLKNPIIHSYKKLSILTSILEKKVDDITFKFVDIVTRKSREDILPDISEQFLIEYRKYKKIQIVEVLTPVKLDESLKKEFIKLAKYYIRKDWIVELSEKVDENLIGGYVVKIGDRQIDDSVSSKLREVRKQLIVS